MIIRASVAEDNQQFGAGGLFFKLCGTVANCGSEARVVVVGNASDAAFDFGRIFFAELLHGEIFYVAAAFAREAGN